MSNLNLRSVTGKDGQPVLFPTGIIIGNDATGGINDIGTPGQVGFGVGVHPGPLPSGFTPLEGYNNPMSDNYGNYQFSDGSIVVWIPAHYYKWGTGANGLAVNEIDIKRFGHFASVSAANTAGYALDRAFYDAGAVQPGFFMDKYLASKSPDGISYGRSIKNGVPISLTTTSTYTRSQGMTGCTGILADAVVLSRARSAGRFNVASIFMYSCLARLSYAHGRASSNTTYCAWYNATHNFPKGCNNNALGDTNDAAILYVTAGDSGAAGKPLTGSANLFARTTHNGQNSGIADLNGAMWEVALGITNPGTSGTDTTQITANGTAFVLKKSVALASLTGGWNGATDAWADAATLPTLYDSVTDIFPFWETQGSYIYFGNGANQVFAEDSNETSAGYRRTACGIQRDNNATSAGGTAAFGSDGCYRYNRANLFALCGGSWTVAGTAGVFARHWYSYRSSTNDYYGFRAAAYGL